MLACGASAAILFLKNKHTQQYLEEMQQVHTFIPMRVQTHKQARVHKTQMQIIRMCTHYTHARAHMHEITHARTLQV